MVEREMKDRETKKSMWYSTKIAHRLRFLTDSLLVKLCPALFDNENCQALSGSGTTEPKPPMLQALSLPAEPQGKPKNSGVGSLSLLQWIFPTQQSSQGLLHCRQILYQESTSCGFPDGSVVKNLPANSGDTVSIPGMERSPGAGNSK